MDDPVKIDYGVHIKFACRWIPSRFQSPGWKLLRYSAMDSGSNCVKLNAAGRNRFRLAIENRHAMTLKGRRVRWMTWDIFGFSDHRSTKSILDSFVSQSHWFQSISRAFLEQFQSIFRAILSQQYWITFQTNSKLHFQSHFVAILVSEQFQCSFRAVLDNFIPALFSQLLT